MKDILNNSMFFGVLVSILAYEVGVLLKKKFKFALLNPLLISIVIIILILVGFHIDYDTYNDGAQLLSYLLTPATVCLAIPLRANGTAEEELESHYGWYYLRCPDQCCLYSGIVPDLPSGA